MMDLGKLWQTIRAWVWQPDLDRIPRWHAAVLRAVRSLWAIHRDLHTGDLSLRAMSLVYTTLLSMVPLLAISFSVLKGFGVHQQLEVAMTNLLLPLGEKGVEIGQRIIEFVDNVKVGVLGSLGLALLIYTVISLMQKIERAFNFIWQVPQERPFAQRFSYYLSVIVIGPLLVFCSIGITASLRNTDIVVALTAIEPFGTAIRVAGELLPFALVVAAFTFIYVFIPNTRVRTASAFVGALVAGVLWHFASLLFTHVVVSSAQYTAIYSAFAGLIVFMLWLYVAWLVLLVGASIAFYHQHPEHLSLERGEWPLSPRMAERLALALLTEIAADFSAAAPRPTLDTLAARLRVSNGTAAESIQALESAGLIVASGDSPPGWLPARPPQSILVSETIAAARANGEIPRLSPDGVQIASGVNAALERIERSRESALSGQTIADLAATAPPGAASTADITALRTTGDPGAAE